MKTLRSCLFLVCILAGNRSGAKQSTKPVEKDKFGVFQCRADAQKWTFDPFDKMLDPKFVIGTAVAVNGQLRVVPHLSYGVNLRALLTRKYEMSVCTHEDSDFEKQFSMYSIIAGSYSEEEAFRYQNFIVKHHLDVQFNKEDTEEFK